MTINELKNKLDGINCEFKRLLEDPNIWNYCGFSSEITKKLVNAEERFLASELTSVMRHIEAANSSLDYLSREIVGEYTLHKNSRGRYECEAREYTCGSIVEYYTYDDYDERYKWVKSRVEHNGEDYYIVSDPDLALEGVKVRIRA